MVDFSKEINFLKPNINIDYNNMSIVNHNIFLKSISKKYKFDSKQIELYNGLSSAIYSIFKFLDLKYCFIYSPCSLEYKNAAMNLNYELRFINRFENLFLPIKDESLVIFANPSYLDGTYYDLEKLFKYWISKNATILVDETLLEFSSQKTSTKYLDSYENFFIIKDFSKYYSNETLRVSAVFSNELNMRSLRQYEPSNKLSNFDMVYLEEAFKDVDFKLISNSINIKNKIELEKVFHSCRYIEVLFQSSSNSPLIKLKDINSENFIQKLQDRDIKISNCLKYDFIDETYINIYVSSKENILKLKEVVNAL